MTQTTATELQRVLERSGLRDPSLTDDDREELFSLALKNTHIDTLEWLAARLSAERRDRS